MITLHFVASIKLGSGLAANLPCNFSSVHLHLPPSDA